MARKVMAWPKKIYFSCFGNFHHQSVHKAPGATLKSISYWQLYLKDIFFSPSLNHLSHTHSHTEVYWVCRKYRRHTRVWLVYLPLRMGHGKNRKLNVCFLLKHNIGDCVVHLDPLDQTVLFSPSAGTGEGEGEEPGEDQCHPSAYNKETASFAVSLNNVF